MCREADTEDVQLRIDFVQYSEADRPALLCAAFHHGIVAGDVLQGKEELLLFLDGGMGVEVVGDALVEDFDHGTVKRAVGMFVQAGQDGDGLQHLFLGGFA